MELKKALVLGKLVGKSRWLVLFASFLIIAFSGATYIFGLYSPKIKSTFLYDQSTLTTLGFFKDLGANIGILTGLLYEVCPPWFILGVGGIMNLTGFLLVWLSVTGKLAHPQKWQMFTYIAIGSNSQTFTNTGAIVTCVRNFPQSRGIVLGILKGFAGLSGAIFTQIYHALYGNNPVSLILLIGWLPCVVCLSCMLLVRPMSPEGEKKDARRFYSFLAIALALAGFLMVVIIVQNHVKFPPVGYKMIAAAVVVFLLLPISVVIKAEVDTLRVTQNGVKQNPVLELGELNKTETIQTNQNLHNLESPSVSPSPSPWYKVPKLGEDYSIPQALVSVDLWLLFIATTCGMGTALAAIDNMGQIGSALGFSPLDVSTFVSLISIWNFLGRVVAGFGSEILLHRYGFPRTAIITCVLAFSCVGHLSIAFAIPGCLYFASIIIGFCLGAQWPVNFAAISELFGLKHYSTLYNVVGSSIPLGSYLMSVRVAGHLYDLEAMKQRDLHPNTTGSASELVCKGVRCFRLAFIIMTCVSLFGAVVSGILVMRSRDFYRGDIYAKYQHQRRESQNGQEIRPQSV